MRSTAESNELERKLDQWPCVYSLCVFGDLQNESREDMVSFFIS